MGNGVDENGEVKKSSNTTNNEKYELNNERTCKKRKWNAKWKCYGWPCITLKIK